MSKKLIKVCAYCRVSTNKEEQEQSFEAQQRYFEEKLNKKNGYELVEIYADKGLTGTEFSKRPEFNRMLSDSGLVKKTNKAKEHEVRKRYISTDYVADGDIQPKFELIFVKDSTRFARNTEVNRILNRLHDKGVYVFFDDLNKSTENTGDRTLIDFMFSIGEQDSISRSNKVKFGAKQSAKAGKVRVGWRMYGYNIDIKNNTLTAISEEANVVKMIFKLRLEGNGGRVIARMLKEQGIKNRKGNDWRPNTINNMLQNPIYTGRLVRNKWSSSKLFGKGNADLRPKEEWIIEETDKIERIVDDETFEKVEKLIEATSEKVGKAKGKYVGRSEFAGKIVCEKCGKNYVKNTDKNYDGSKRIFYNCSTKKQHGAILCDSKNLQGHEVEDLISSYIKRNQYKKTTEKLLNEVIKLQEEKKSTLYIQHYDVEKVQNIKDEIEKYKNKLTKLITLMLDDDSNTIKDVYIQQKKEMNDNIKILEIKLEEITATDKQREAKLNRINNNINELQEYYEKISDNITREEFIETHLVNIIVKKDGTIQMISKAHMLYVVLKKLLK